VAVVARMSALNFVTGTTGYAAIVIAIRGWMADNAPVRAEVEALTDVPVHLKADILDCLDAAAAADRQTWLYDLSAPIVMLLVLPFVRRGADKLPSLFRRWDNNVSLNGDGEAVFIDGEFLTAGHGISWEDYNAALARGAYRYTYDDPLYHGDAYYAKGHHPRSFWARYVWVGLRNRASQLSADMGLDVPARPQLISGSLQAGRSRPGHFLLREGGVYHYKSFRKFGPFALIRSYGYKLEIVRNSPTGAGRAAAVAIGRSLKGWRG